MSLLALCVSLAIAAGPITLENDLVRADLGCSSTGFPIVQSLSFKGAATSFVSQLPDFPAPLPDDLIPQQQPSPPVQWMRGDSDAFLRATSELPLPGDIALTHVVELSRDGAILRTHYGIANHGTKPCPVDWFPIWVSSWNVPGARTACGWHALSFAPCEEPLDGENPVQWGSRLHSSDSPNNGMNPYWNIATPNGTMFFALEWCGGWHAELSSRNDILTVRVCLPSEETQLILAPGDSVDGPAMLFAAFPQDDPVRARAEWMKQRASLARRLYGGPPPAYPFAYNNWYTTRFDVDAAFLKRQLANMDPYGFDAFVVDAGWYESVGNWTPAPAKFAPGELDDILGSIKAKGVMPGIWTCPQFIRAQKDALPPEVDQPPFYEKFIDGYLLDLAGHDFKQKLADHVTMLRERYGAQWWKYDQLLFAAKSRAGVMRNVIAFQDALKAVRAGNPDLIIENCQSGGRMTNELTVLATQSQWLRDGGNTGLGHARDNISVTLGALNFIFPWAANRWTNNPDQIDPADDELLRYYCRSAMAGTWGLVADLGAIREHQRDIIVKEMEHYRKINALKSSYLYDISYPQKGSDAAHIVYYDPPSGKASAIVYRWDATGAFNWTIPVPYLEPGIPEFAVEDADTDLAARESRKVLVDQGLRIQFTPERRSALVTLYPAP